MPRTAEIERKSKETQIKVSLNIDGAGKTKIKTPIGFLDHMLELFTFHGYFDTDPSHMTLLKTKMTKTNPLTRFN